MDVEISNGESRVTVSIPDERLIELRRHSPPYFVPANGDAIRRVLDEPIRFPPLRQALTPDDHIAIVVDGNVIGAEQILAEVAEYLRSAGIQHENITAVLAKDLGNRRMSGLTVEIHEPRERERLSYLATTKAGRRIYVNRTVVEADQIIVISEVRYGTPAGIGGGFTTLFPSLSDEDTRESFRGTSDEVIAAEAREVIWLLGMPFFIHIVYGADQLVAGTADTLTEAKQVLAQHWRVSAKRTADVGVVTMPVVGAALTTAEFAAAVHTAAQVVKRGGAIILIADAAPDLGPGFEFIRESGSPAAALKWLKSHRLDDGLAARTWLQVVSDRRILVMSRWPDDLVEDLFAGPIATSQSLQRLIDGASSVVVIPSAHRTLAELDEESQE